MATLTYKSGRALIQWFDPHTSIRRSLRTKVPSRVGAEAVRTHVAFLVAAKSTACPVQYMTATWLRDIGEPLYAKLARGGLIGPRGGIVAAPGIEPKLGPKVLARLTLTYFVQGESSGPVKIGKTYQIDKRIAELQCGSPVPLRCLGTLAGNREDEMHRRFAAHRINGEWFRAAPELLDFIAKECR